MSGPDPDQLADAQRRAAFEAEHIAWQTNAEGPRILAFDTLTDFIFDVFEGERSQVAWALLWVEAAEREGERPFERHERLLIENAWKKVREDAEQHEWEQLGLRQQGGNA